MKRFSLDTKTMPWKEEISNSTGQTLLKKYLLESDGDTGMCIEIITYPKGYMNNWHRHPCSHSMLVLRGKLQTEDGHIYKEGDFIHFPEGDLMRHGATAEEDCEILFITNKKFAMIYEENK